MEIQIILVDTYVPMVVEEAVLEHACACEIVVLEHTLALGVALLARTCALAVALLAHTCGLQVVLLEYTCVVHDEVAPVVHACVLEAVVPKNRRVVQSDCVGSVLVHFDRSAHGLDFLSLEERRAARDEGKD